LHAEKNMTPSNTIIIPILFFIFHFIFEPGDDIRSLPVVVNDFF